MKRRTTLATVALALTAALVAAPSVCDAATIVLPRAGQVGFAFSGQAGTLLRSGDFGQEFGGGGGLAVRLRYRMRFERAMGLTFDMQRLGARDASGEAGAFDALTDAPVVTREQLRLNNAGLEFYQMFDTRTRTTRYLSAGFGLSQINAKLSNGETQYPRNSADALYLSAGAGIERFFWRSWAYDVGVRYQALLHDGGLNHGLQANAGFVFYAAY